MSQFGGGGRGRFQSNTGGRGGPPGGSGGRGNRHMGQIPAINTLVNQISAKDILAVIAPADGGTGPTRINDPITASNPPRAAWRDSNPIGVILDPTRAGQVVRSNHFKVNTTRMPGRIFLYQIALSQYNRTGALGENIAAEEDTRTMTGCVLKLKTQHPEWGPIKFAFNGHSLIYTSLPIPLPEADANGKPFIAEDVVLTNPDGRPNIRNRWQISLTEVDQITYPSSDDEFAVMDNLSGMTALETALSSFARWGVIDRDPVWQLNSGNKLFSSTAPTCSINSRVFVVQRGYYLGLKQCLAGLTFVCDMTCNLFLQGGEMIDLLINSSGCKNLDELRRQSKAILQNTKQREKINEDIKNAKVGLKYITFNRKAKSIGPPANDKDSQFDFNGQMLTVAQYFELMAGSDPSYTQALQASGGKLKYPDLMTINIGSGTKPVLIPPELMFVPKGQCRANSATPDMVAQLIKYAAVKPQERFQLITDHSTLSAITTNETASLFGLDSINHVPMAHGSRILPPAKLLYKNGATVEPRLNGEWRMEETRHKFYKSPPGNDGGLGYATLQVTHSPQHGMPHDGLTSFERDMLKSAAECGLHMKSIGPPLKCPPTKEGLQSSFGKMIHRNARIAVVIMCTTDSCYGAIKLAADSLGLITQCIKDRTIQRDPKGLCRQLALKLNVKMGGANHVLATRATSTVRKPAATAIPGSRWVGEDPPSSISWLFQVPTMLMGMDVSHPERGSEQESIAAVVASIDPQCAQYLGQIDAQKTRQEMIGNLDSMVEKLLQAFKTRNGVMPKHVVCFRDGVADGQFEAVRNVEVAAIHSAFEHMGYERDSVKIAFIVCQKGHNTRLFYQDDNGEMINPCPGLLIDGNSQQSMTSATMNDFYLNSHVAIQGTCKPCKYTLLYDEIGMKMSEIELLSYWTTYLYCRCNRSVSYATPAYYAHHLSKRGAALFAAGGAAKDLTEISDVFSNPSRLSSTMFFI